MPTEAVKRTLSVGREVKTEILVDGHGDFMKCENCDKGIPADDWVFLKTGGPSGNYCETVSQHVGVSRVFCSKECMDKKWAADHQQRLGY